MLLVPILNQKFLEIFALSNICIKHFCNIVVSEDLARLLAFFIL
jgi:hypothetical protein